MTTTLQPVIDSLRNELQQYGEMLALLEAQREVVAHREPRSVLTSISAVEAQSGAIEIARRDREKARRQLAWALGRADTDESFQALLPFLPDEYRPLISALVSEINELLLRVRACAELNHTQLRRALELMERFIASISPQAQAALMAGLQVSPSGETPPLSATA